MDPSPAIVATWSSPCAKCLALIRPGDLVRNVGLKWSHAFHVKEPDASVEG